MGFKNGCYCTVWKDQQTQSVINRSEKNYADISISISKKNKDGKYETDFSSRVRFIGKAYEKVKDLALQDQDRLKLLEVETQYKYSLQHKKAFANFICWDFECVDKVYKDTKVDVVGELDPLDDSQLPF